MAASTASFCTPAMPQSWTLPAVGLLGVDDRDVGVERGNRDELLAGERAGDRLDVSVCSGSDGAEVAAHHRERQAGGAGDVAVGHPGVAVLLDLELRPAVLDRVAEAVQRADAGVAALGEDQLARAAGADHLVVDHVRGHPDQLRSRRPWRMISCPAATGIRWVKPSSATVSPSWTSSATASAREVISAVCSHSERWCGTRTVSGMLPAMRTQVGDRRRRARRADARPPVRVAGHRVGGARGARPRIRPAARPRRRARAGDDGPDGRGGPRRADARARAWCTTASSCASTARATGSRWRI